MMKPLGLEGKVGAPAIVKANPFETARDRCMSVFSSNHHYQYDEQEVRISQLFDHVGPFRWEDALSFVQSLYESMGDAIELSDFLWHASGMARERVLVYDLDTPRLNARFQSRDAEPKLVVLRGSCNRLGVSRCGLIADDVIGFFGTVFSDERVGAWSRTGWYELQIGKRRPLFFPGDSCLILPYRADADGITTSLSSRSIEPADITQAHPVVVLSGIPLMHPPCVHVCPTGYTEPFQRITARVLDAVADPATFVAEIPRLQADLFEEYRRCFAGLRSPLPADHPPFFFDPERWWRNLLEVTS